MSKDISPRGDDIFEPSVNAESPPIAEECKFIHAAEVSLTSQRKIEQLLKPKERELRGKSLNKRWFLLFLYFNLLLTLLPSLHLFLSLACSLSLSLIPHKVHLIIRCLQIFDSRCAIHSSYNLIRSYLYNKSLPPQTHRSSLISHHSF